MYSLGHQSSKVEESNQPSIWPKKDADLTRCSQYISIPCNTLAGFLSVQKSVVANIESEFTGESVHKYHILKTWVNKNSVTKQEVYDKLVALGQTNAAERFYYTLYYICLSALIILWFWFNFSTVLWTLNSELKITTVLFCSAKKIDELANLVMCA